MKPKKWKHKLRQIDFDVNPGKLNGFKVGMMISGIEDDQGDCCDPPPQTIPPTPNGKWRCVNNECIWIPEIG